MTTPAPSKIGALARDARFQLAALAAVCLGLYAPTLGVGLMSDDYGIFAVLERPGVDSLGVFPAGSGAYFRPLVLASLEAMLSLPLVLHHLFSLLLHLATVLLIRHTSLRLGTPAPVAFALALLFAVHSAHVAPVIWLAARGDLWVGFWGVLAILAAIACRSSQRLAPLLLSAAALIGALLSKESGTAVLVAALAFYYLTPSTEPSARLRPWVVPGTLGLAAVLTLVLTRAKFQGEGLRAMRIFESSAPATDLLKGSLKALQIAVFPFETSTLARIYKTSPGLLLATATIAALAGAIALWLWWKPNRRGLGILLGGTALFLTALAPTMLGAGGIAPRHLYFPIAVALLWAARFLRPPDADARRRLVAAGVAVAVTVMSAWTLYQATIWLRNDRWTRQVCTDFASLTASGAPDSVVVLAVPSHTGSVPVFANDFVPAMRRCVGDLPATVVELSRVRSGVLPPHSAASLSADGLYQWQARDIATHVDPRDLALKRRRDELGSVAAVEHHAHGGISLLRFQLSAETLSSSSILTVGDELRLVEYPR